MPHALVLTALPVEYQAVRAHLINFQEATHSNGTVYERGQFHVSGKIWDVAIIEIVKGSPGAISEAERAIAYFCPDIILCVGVAGGIKDVEIGDVVASTKIYRYESGKEEQFFRPRSEIVISTYNLVQQARAEVREGDWLKRLRLEPDHTPQVLVAPIAASSKVFVATQLDIFQFFQSNFRDAVAVEIGGIGFLEAVRANPWISAIIIRGISDLIDGKDDTDKRGYQEIAAKHASAFAFEILAKFQYVESSIIANSRYKATLRPAQHNQIPRLYKSIINPRSMSPKIFISYSRDSQEHKKRVLELADRLRADGIDCNIDQYEESPAEGWQRWMLNQVEVSTFVLVVCTEQYDRRFRGREESGKGKGETWEGGVIIDELYQFQGRNSKFIPIILSQNDSSFIPRSLRDFTFYRLDKADGYELLYRRLTNQPRTSRLALGKLKPLLPRSPVMKKEFCNLPQPRHQDFVGRKKEIAELLKRISPDYRQHMNVVRGIGGVGKTALVLEVARRCWEARNTINSDAQNLPVFDAIIFTSSKSTDMVNTRLVNRPEREYLLTDIYRVISNVFDEPIITQVMETEQLNQVYNTLERPGYRTLLIVDNMETLTEEEQNKILSFLNEVPFPTKVIITTRDFLGFDGIQIKELNQAESFQLLNSQAKLKNLNIDKSWKESIYNRFNGIPIALIYAVGKRAAGYSFDEITKPSIELPKDLGKFCFDSSVTPLRGTSAHKLLVSMTFFRTLPCRDALIRVAGLTDGNQEDISEAFAKLQQLSLITEENRKDRIPRYSILSITLEFARAELETSVDVNFRRSAEERWFSWYLEFVQLYGGYDWDGWRAKYDHIKVEWENIEVVLNWYASREEWTKVMNLWTNIDNYMDLNGYWQKRREWWADLGKQSGSAKIQVRALSEKGSTLILMGTEMHIEAEDYLNRAWSLREEADIEVQASLANHLAVLAKAKENYSDAHKWLDTEEFLLNNSQIPEDEKKRFQVRNLYYRAEINQLENKIVLAKQQFENVIETAKKIGWQRFKNYAKNSLANILIEVGDLELAEKLIISGRSVAISADETRRIALFDASYANLHYRLAQRAREEKSSEVRTHIDEAIKSAQKALTVFKKELMVIEKNEVELLINLINEM